MERADRDRVRQIPLGVIPCGTSNGLSATLGCFDVPSAALLIIRGHSRPMDMMKATLADKPH